MKNYAILNIYKIKIEKLFFFFLAIQSLIIIVLCHVKNKGLLNYYKFITDNNIHK